MFSARLMFQSHIVGLSTARCIARAMHRARHNARCCPAKRRNPRRKKQGDEIDREYSTHHGCESSSR
jgi:hypothetical protein